MTEFSLDRVKVEVEEQEEEEMQVEVTPQQYEERFWRPYHALNLPTVHLNAPGYQNDPALHDPYLLNIANIQREAPEASSGIGPRAPVTPFPPFNNTPLESLLLAWAWASHDYDDFFNRYRRMLNFRPVQMSFDYVSALFIETPRGKLDIYVHSYGFDDKPLYLKFKNRIAGVTKTIRAPDHQELNLYCSTVRIKRQLFCHLAFFCHWHVFHSAARRATPPPRVPLAPIHAPNRKVPDYDPDF